ncbi:MAG: hypothetical protein ACE5G0_00370 [Rhodothermales bacterium]
MTPGYRWGVLLALLFLFSMNEATAQTATPSPASVLRAQVRRLSPLQLDEVLWLARCIYSESDRAHEQRLVAWVVRNRVETAYRGESYREVVLEPRQFSAFNEPSTRRNHILSLNQHSLSASWRQALGIALDVYRAPASKRPFPITTRHFYSPVSMDGGRTPHWAENAPSLSSARLGIDPQRFRFFDNVDEGDASPALASNRTEAASSEANPSADKSIANRVSKRRSSILNRLRTRTFSGRVKRPVRPVRDRRSKK